MNSGGITGHDYSNSSSPASEPLSDTASKVRPAHASWASNVTTSSSTSNVSEIQSPRPINGNLQIAGNAAKALESLERTRSASPRNAKSSPKPEQNSDRRASLAPFAYPIMEISRMDQTKQQALDALHHIERRTTNKPHVISPSLVGARPTQAQPVDASKILTYIQELERKVAALQAKDSTPAESQDDDQVAEPASAGSTLEVPSFQQPRPATPIRAEPVQSNPWIVEIKRFKKLNYRYGSAELYDDSETIEAIRARESAARGGGYVLNVYREYDWEGNALNSKLEICSTPLLELIRDLIDYYPGPEFDLLRWEDTVGDTVTFSEPYMMLFTHRSELNGSLEKPNIPEETKTHVRLLLQFLREEMPRTSAKLDEIEAGTCKKISFQDLWLLYPPNTSVYTNVNGEDRQMVVYSRNVPEKNLKGQWGVLSLYCWSAMYRGNNLIRDFYPWVTQPFTGEKFLAHLDLVPIQYLPNRGEVQERLIERGHRYYLLNEGPTLQDYSGNQFPRVFKDVCGFSHKASLTDCVKEPVRVVVDQDTYWTKCGLEATRHEDPSEEYGFPDGEDSLVDQDGKPYERALVCCYPQIGVFSLRDKEWALVRVSELQAVQFREKAFKRLVIKDEYKKLIIAMVQAYMLEQPGFSDIVTGKGRGLTILLHGPPGTGKTLTAECLAEKQQRPLYKVSCGDLGTEPLELERRLKEIFAYAVAWKAILLMDEADIFMQERDMHDVKRNALVSIFLRELEYFDGVIMLTTNRPGDIDEAFQSRIHVSIGLKALDTTERRKVWAVFIKELNDLSDKEKAALLQYVTDNFDGDKLNGRQIRNSIRTALALAQLKKEKLNAEHLERVVKIGREFAGYMEGLNKMNAEEYAVALGRRAPAR
ncbi:MAG: hypothetical protein Q9227_007980 [Pyrenula ochraceoflavens]